MLPRIAHCAPLWVVLDPEAEMIVEKVILYSTAFVGHPLPSGRFDLAGSGFFVYLRHGDYAFTYFVTAHHVIDADWRRRDAPFPPQGDIYVRINRKDGKLPYLLKTAKSDWLYHQDRRAVDLCAYLIDDRREDPNSEWEVGWLNIRALSLTSVIAGSAGIPIVPLWLGDEVFIVGAFPHRIGEKKNIPIVRKGSVAALLDEPIEHASPRHPAYLIETRSLGGISGSPVFFDVATREGKSGRVWGPATVTNTETGESLRPTTLLPYRLVGMVLGTWGVNGQDFLATTESDVELTDADINSGITAVMSVDQITDFLESPALKDLRTAALERREKESSYRPTSAARAEPE